MPVTVPPEQDNYWILGTEHGIAISQKAERQRLQEAAWKMFQEKKFDAAEISYLLNLPIETVQQLLEEARNN